MGVLIELIRKLNDSLGVTSVAVSHDVNEVLSIADFACVISEGRVVAEGTPEALLASESEYVQQFLQGLPDGPVPFDYPAKPFLQDLI
jgi:phospholipid/cholesterol/gamma-HCH transport system ATP-binding protein